MDSVRRFVDTATNSYECGNGSGYECGNGSGYGYGNGSGNGDGSGYGYGSGDGSGNGIRFGYGSGSGYGRGYGHGSGSGRGDGSGFGNGYGSSEGIKSINNMPICNIDDTQTAIKSVRGNIAKGFVFGNAMALTPTYIAYVNGYFAHGKTVREAVAYAEAKRFHELGIECKIAEFKKTFDNKQKYPNSEFFKWHNLLTGSCKMGREAFAEQNGIDVENGEMTVKEFIELTKNAYGGEIIRRLEESNDTIEN